MKSNDHQQIHLSMGQHPFVQSSSLSYSYKQLRRFSEVADAVKQTYQEKLKKHLCVGMTQLLLSVILEYGR